MNLPSAPNALVEAEQEATRQFSLLRRVAAWAVHAYTASGVVAGFLALCATFRGEARAALLWMLVAVLIDATDGTLARAVKIKWVLPWFDGAKLDDIVDYYTFVIVPVVFLYQLRLLPAHGTLFFVALPLLASAYGFCQAAAKTPDFFFTGFPSYWNIVALYLYAGQTPLWLNGALVFTSRTTRAALPEQDVVRVKLKKGPNRIVLKINNGDGAHGFYFTILSEQELRPIGKK